MLLSSAASESVDLVSLDTGSMGPELYVNQFFCLEIFFCCFSIFTRDVKVTCSDFFSPDVLPFCIVGTQWREAALGFVMLASVIVFPLGLSRMLA